MTISNPCLVSTVAGSLGSSQNRGVTTAPPASPGNLDDMPSSGQNSTDLLGAGVQKKIIRPQKYILENWRVILKNFSVRKANDAFLGSFLGPRKIRR